MSLINLETIHLGLTNLRLHKLRSLLTALGIIFGVAAVICMLSISEGASADEMRMIQLLGTQNIIVNSVKPEETTEASEGTQRLLEYGITEDDVRLIRRTIPHIDRIVPLKSVAYSVRRRDKRFDGKVIGTTPDFFDVVNVSVARGRRLTDLDMEERAKVCVIGSEVSRAIFAFEDPIGQSLFAERYEGTVPYVVVGVLEEIHTAGAPARGVDDRDINREIYFPFSTSVSRYGAITLKPSTGAMEFFKLEYSGLYVHVDELDHVEPVSEMVTRVLEYGHDKVDYEVRVPLARLKMAQKKMRNDQIILGCIAGISLIVGGIGIMNIMLATVTERTREIGIRRALGAKRRDITVQFLVETVVLSAAGGLCGVVLGCSAAYAINQFAAWDTIIRWWSVGVSFSLSVFIGVFFGMYPAISAARLDPIEALRCE
ncbi:MAG: ABC transporter permease [Planctomycetes bacterium]|nr:ABC transporter permease [Planctomycetota bacterium]